MGFYVGGGGGAGAVFEDLGKIQRVRKAALGRKLGNGAYPRFDLLQGVPDPQVIEVLGEIDLHFLLEQGGKILLVIKEQAGNAF